MRQISAARFRDDFESAVLHAVNGGGQNQARAMLTGTLVGNFHRFHCLKYGPCSPGKDAASERKSPTQAEIWK
jgi:hypothetical protein